MSSINILKNDLTFVKNKLTMIKNKLGQYFTTNIILQKKIFEFILNEPSNILEQSFGRGDLIKYIIDKNPNIIFDMYEIDNKIELLDKNNKDKIIYGDFYKKKLIKNIKL